MGDEQIMEVLGGGPAGVGTSSAGGGVRDFVKLARPHQWGKGVFVMIGPVFGLADRPPADAAGWAAAGLAVLGAVLAFGLAASGCYVFNDIKDREADRLHPRKRNRPIAAGRVSVSAAGRLAVGLWALAGLSLLLIPGGAGVPGGRELTAALVALYVVNVVGYSAAMKRVPVLDVVSLASGFVLRALGGCAAVGAEPSSWLLNCTFFFSLFLALGKRLGERRTMGELAAGARSVQGWYTDDFLRMSVVVTAVAALVSYSDYVEAQAAAYTLGMNWLWLTILPATFALLRCIILLERGEYDDPTELAAGDRGFQAAVALFGAMTLLLLAKFKMGWM